LTERVLVTGATGFIGTHLVHHLVKMGVEVICLVRSTSKTSRLDNLGVSFIEGDITRKESLTEAVSLVDTVFHLAGLTTSFKVESFFHVNEEGTRNLVETCAEAGKQKRLVVVSSSSAVGPSSPGRAMTEEDPPKPISHYGRSKLAGEQVARKWAERLPITIVRPPIVFGEYDRDVFRMFELVAHGWHIVPGWKKKYYSLIHAADLAEALILAAQKGEVLPAKIEDFASPGQGIYFIADAWSPSYAELGPLMAKALGRKARILPVPGSVVWGVGFINEVTARLRGKPSILNLDKAKDGLTGSWVYSSQKAAAQVGFVPDATVSERIYQTGRWYQEQGWL